MSKAIFTPIVMPEKTVAVCATLYDFPGAPLDLNACGIAQLDPGGRNQLPSAAKSHFVDAPELFMAHT